MALETVVNIADLVKTNPTGSDPKSQGDDHIRNLKTALLNNFAGFDGAVCVTGTDGGSANAYTLTPTNPLPAYGSKMIAVFSPTITNSAASTLNISGLGLKSIKSVAGAVLVAGDLAVGSVYLAMYNGTEFQLLSITKEYVDLLREYVDQVAFQAALPAQALGFLRSDGVAAGFTQTHTGYAQNEVKGADIASAATINLTTATGNLVHVTGAITITAITIPIGAERTVIFDGALTLTHGAGLLLPGAANIITEAGDRMVVRGDTAGANVTGFTRANGASVAGPPYLKVSDQKASGTAAGASLAADITQTRTLNTVNTNTISGASLAANVITLPAGTYQVRCRAPACGGGFNKAFLYNATDAAYTIVGSSAKESTQATNADSLISGQFTIAASKTFTIRHYTSIAAATSGLGQATTTGQVEVYTEAEFWKVT